MCYHSTPEHDGQNRPRPVRCRAHGLGFGLYVRTQCAMATVRRLIGDACTWMLGPGYLLEEQVRWEPSHLVIFDSKYCFSNEDRVRGTGRRTQNPNGCKCPVCRKTGPTHPIRSLSGEYLRPARYSKNLCASFHIQLSMPGRPVLRKNLSDSAKEGPSSLSARLRDEGFEVLLVKFL